MTPNARRLMAVIQSAGRRRTIRYLRHTSCLTCTRMADAANELLREGEVRAVTQAGCPVTQVREGGESVLLELNEEGSAGQ